jgi:hypothetical protein
MTNLLPPEFRPLLTSATRLDDEGLAAYRHWRARVPLDDIPYVAHLVMPRLVELARSRGINDPDIERMRGVSRHVWTSNMLLLKALFAAVSALEGTGIRPLMLKSAALMARDPAVASKHRAADYDILIAPRQLPRAVEALRAAGFVPSEGFNWNNLDGSMAERIAGAVEIRLPGTRSGIDLHWQPIWNIHDPILVTRVTEGGQTMTMQGHEVVVPQPAHQLFLALARCERWDTEECFRRLLEGHQVLASAASKVDWSELVDLCRHYRLEAAALSYLETLRETTGAAIPDSAFAGLQPDARQRREWEIRATPPDERTILDHRIVIEQEIAGHRAAPGTVAPGWFEAVIRQYWTLRPPLRLLWWLAQRRYRGATTGRPRFLEGFWYPEADGCWTRPGWAVVAVPGADGNTVTLDATLFLGKTDRVRIGAAGGGRPFQRTTTSNETEIRLPVKPVAGLGGDGLLLLWTPDAPSPSETGSADKRRLGAFLRYGWRR